MRGDLKPASSAPPCRVQPLGPPSAQRPVRHPESPDTCARSVHRHSRRWAGARTPCRETATLSRRSKIAGLGTAAGVTLTASTGTAAPGEGEGGCTTRPVRGPAVVEPPGSFGGADAVCQRAAPDPEIIGSCPAGQEEQGAAGQARPGGRRHGPGTSPRLKHHSAAGPPRPAAARGRARPRRYRCPP